MSDTVFTGPVKAGNVLQSDGTGNLAGVGGSSGTANVGYAVMAQSAVITQAASGGGGTGVSITGIVIPAQSQILSITLMVTTAWSGAAKTLGVGTTVSATALTAAGAMTSLDTLGPATPATPGTDATRIGTWDNVGDTDIQIITTSTNTGNGVGTLTVSYIQSNNSAS